MKDMMDVDQTMCQQTWGEEMRTCTTCSCTHIACTRLPSLASLRSTEETKVGLSTHISNGLSYSAILFAVILPTSALHELARLKISYPMTFMISNPQMGMKTYCGVLEFSAEEGMCHIPIWMMNNLCVEEGSEIILRNMNLNKGTFIKIKPHETAFINLANPKAM